MAALLLTGLALAGLDAEFEDLGIPEQVGAEGIWGGERTNQYPNVVALAEMANWGTLVFCTGTLVDERWIVTAAHCLYGKEGLLSAGDLSVLFGDDINLNGYNDAIRFSDFVLHPQYVDGAFDYDIAVVELSSPKNGIDFAVLNDEPIGQDWGGKSLTFVGFGMTDFNVNDSGTKRVTEIPIVSYDEMIVYSEHATSNICQGDSGGPGFETTDSGALELAGVNSFIYAGCSGGGGGATRIDVVIDWIASHVPNILRDSGETTDGGDDPTGDDDDDLGTDPPIVDGGDSDLVYSDTTESPGGCATSPGTGGLAFTIPLLAMLLGRRP